MSDQLELLEGARIQHGRDGRRIYLMSLPEAGAEPWEQDEALIQELFELYREKSYTKIFAKVPARRAMPFLRWGFRIEALVPRMFRGEDDVFFLAWYGGKGKLSSRSLPDVEQLRLFDSLLRNKRPVRDFVLPGNYRWFHCTQDDLQEMAELYRRVFDRYPFPIHKTSYLAQTMEDDVEYFGVRRRDGNQLIALSSAELHPSFNSIEMTDFAVDPEFRGEGLGQFLLRRMDEYATDKRIPVAYTIARLASLGMNASFIKAGYHFAGTLSKNTYIGGGLESMNVFYKVLMPVHQ